LTVILVSAIVCGAMGMVPLPKHLNYGGGEAMIGSNAVFSSNSHSQLLQAAISRLHDQIFIFNAPPSANQYQLDVSVKSDDENLQFGVDESYDMKVQDNRASITANTVWGAMHGLQTFAQLVAWNGTRYTIPSTPIMVTDAPRFPWRGFMIDTARHFMDVDTLKRQVEGMVASKLNVLHWHAVDAESFPVVSQTEPALAKGAYSAKARYSQSDMQEVIQYAKARGVRVVIEFDVPGHSASWGVGMPSIVAKCPQYSHNINNIPLNPTLDKTWQVLTNLFTEMASLFPDRYFHTGGDEVVTGCFSNDPSIWSWMQSHGMNSGGQLYAYFESKLADLMKPLNKIRIVWEDVFNAGIPLEASSTLVHVWSNHDTLAAITKKGIKAITSAGWYLGVQVPDRANIHPLFFDTWQDFYNNDPILPGMTQQQIALVLGGEAAQWGEQVDSFTVDAISWPRTAAVAERLWSPKEVTDISSMKLRLNQHWCLLTRRGVHASPIQPGYCDLP
jgi:hexosaminidase